MYVFESWMAENSEKLDSDLIYGKFTKDQMVILSTWIESAYDAGHDDGCEQDDEWDEWS